jgi:hypothetical protein
MIKVEENEKEFIINNIKNGAALLQSNNLRDLLLPLDALITEKGFDINDDLNDFGRKAQRIYDNIYYNN